MLDHSALAESLVSEGELHLLRGDFSAVALFDQAIQLDATHSDLFYRQGLALFEYGSEEGKGRALHLASKKFKLATALNPSCFDSWQAWGNTLLLLGTTYKQHHYFLEAKKRYQQALKLAAGKSPDLLCELFWDYGAVCMQIAHHSQEALDFQLTLDAFQKASSYQEDLPAEFWQDYGRTSLELAARINDIRLYVKAINCFKHALSIGGTSFESWFNLGKALELLYAQTHDEDHFSQANECFNEASAIAPQDPLLWLHWACFLSESGRRNADVKRLRLCIEKCHQAYVCDPQQKETIALWAETLALLGELSDRVDLIYEAQNKISEIPSEECDEPNLLFSWGMCLHSFGQYFNDTEYFLQAIEQFQHALSIDRTHHKLWHAMGRTYMTIGQINADKEDLEKAVRFFGKAIDLHASSFYIFDKALALSKLGEITSERKWIEEAITYFERALGIQKNAIYLHPDWLFHYAVTLDMIGDFYEDESFYLKAIEILSHVLMIDPDFPSIYHRLALAYSHLGDLMGDTEYFQKAVHYYRLAAKNDEDNDEIIDDWGMALLNIAERSKNSNEVDQTYRDAEHKLTHAAKLGNKNSYYHLSCLFSLVGQQDKAMRFLEKADAFKALPPLDDLMQDDWLEGLRLTEDFRLFLSQLENRPNLHQ